MKVIAPILLIAFVLLVVADLIVGFPFPVFLGAMVVLGITSLALGRLFETRKPGHLLGRVNLRLQLTSGCLFVTDDFNFRRGQEIVLPPGEYAVALELNEAGDGILGLQIAHSAESLVESEIAVPVSYGLLYLVDRDASTDKKFQGSVRDFVAGRMDVPVAEEVRWEGTRAAVIVEPLEGNGEYRMLIGRASIRIDFGTDEKDLGVRT